MVGVSDTATIAMIYDVPNVRRKVFLLEQCSVTLETRNELYRFDSQQEKRIERYDQKIAAGQTNVPYPSPDPDVVERVSHLRAYESLLAAVQTEAVRLEDDLLISFYNGEAIERELAEDATTDLTRRWQELILRAYALTYIDVKADKVTLCLWFQPASAEFALMLAEAYVAVAERNELRVAISSLEREENYDRRLKDDEFWIARPSKNPDTGQFQPQPGVTTMVGRKLETTSAVAKAVHRKEVVGLALRVRGSLATPLLEAEVGRHEWQRTNLLHRCLIGRTGRDVADIVMDLDELDWKSTSKVERIRIWNERKSRVQANDLRGEGLVWSKSKTVDCLAKILKDRLLKQAEQLLD